MLRVLAELLSEYWRLIAIILFVGALAVFGIYTAEYLDLRGDG